MRRWGFGVAGIVLGMLGCDHTRPVAPVSETGDVGPYSGSQPYRLTFNRGGDVDPGIAGDRIVFSRRPIPQDDTDWCIAYLPILGGTLLDETRCPDDGAANGTKDAWLQPRISPDGERLAFVVETGSTGRFNLSPTFRRLVVGPPEAPARAAEVVDVSIGLFSIQGPFGLIPANSIHRLQWFDNDHLLFIAGTQKTLSGQFCCDTLYVPMAAIRVDVNSGAWEILNLGPLPPADVTVGTGGDIFFTQAEDPAYDLPDVDCATEAPVCPQNQVMALAPDGTTRLVADLTGSGEVSRIVAAGPSLLAIDRTGSMFSIDPGTGQVDRLFPNMPAGAYTIDDVAFAPAHDLIVALLGSPGSPSNLWLVRYPR